MRANSSDPQGNVTAEHPIKPERLRLLDRLSKYRQPIGLAVTLLLFAIALIACRHLLAELDLDALHDSILDVPKPALLGAFGATVVGFIILLAILSAARTRRTLPTAHAGPGLPPFRLQAIGLSCPAVRCDTVYMPAGLSHRTLRTCTVRRCRGRACPPLAASRPSYLPAHPALGFLPAAR